jgi:hypothetical protein
MAIWKLASLGTGAKVTMSRQKPPTTPPGADIDAFVIDIALRLPPVCSTLAALCPAGLACLEAVAPEAVKDTLADEAETQH